MPESDNKIRHVLLAYLRKVGLPSTVLDIGVGSGFYGKALRSFRNDIYLYGIEIWDDYIKKFKLDSIYNEIFCIDMLKFDYLKVQADLVILADVVEHVSKTAALSLIGRLKQHYKWILITIPVIHYEQGSYGGNPYEAHLHHWTKEELSRDLGMLLLQDCGICGLFEWKEGQKRRIQEELKIGCTVKLHFTSYFDDGTVYETSLGSEPLQFTIGQGRVILGLEEAVAGMNVGESKTIIIPADKAFGTYDESKENAYIIDRALIPGDTQVEVGMSFHVQQPDGKTNVFRVTDISESTVRLERNHPFSGKELIYKFTILDIQ
jgi:peptidylprolyl isomerase